MDNKQQVLVVDLDGTLLHPEPEAIAVPGRVSYRYLSQKSANLLADISKLIPIVIATARNAQNVKQLVQQIPDVCFWGFVTENGLVAKFHLDETPRTTSNWNAVTNLLPNWSQLTGYENCLGLIAPKYFENSDSFLRKILFENDITGYVYLDGHKIFIYPSMPSKLKGIQFLKFFPLITLGNDLNDLNILNASHYTATLSTAHEEVKEVVNRKGGYCSSLNSHAATEELLLWTYELVTSILKYSNLQPV
ncbi:HAD hydrolase family protein [Nostocaceae cyanobacterium CENA369]|uniref:HAD hydrolase family protein n=1 Tax=Dendronalium phyllosphericum CENA369 TaxID=1725256 RepID=A0A8J7IAD1_9NOST|nr:HAD hydrolase family protein [Dendronalium phyllosphericum]MBH8577038.1 HAD hydrolase family protein [Dendronalium phyllosphericum CENA369]